jgi:hypothetical protein
MRTSDWNFSARQITSYPSSNWVDKPAKSRANIIASNALVQLLDNTLIDGVKITAAHHVRTVKIDGQPIKVKKIHHNVWKQI